MPSLKFQDTYLEKTVEIKPDDYKHRTLNIYTCGPTVYNYMHVGNMYASFFGSLVADCAKFLGFEVKWASNITDVGHLVGDGDNESNVVSGEDKMEKAAKREGLKVREIVDHYTEHFREQARLMNIQLPVGIYNPVASNYISEQAQLALEILNKGLGYVNKIGIYFDSSKLDNLKDLPVHQVFKIKKVLDNENFSSRDIAGNKNSKNPEDFALWRFVNPNSLQKWRLANIPEIKDEFALTLSKSDDEEVVFLQQYGVPGWHAECVSMIVGVFENHKGAYAGLKDNKYIIDIHTGGEDHISVHHKNEIIQSCALNIQLSKYWLHNKHILVDGTKMSKSLGNSYLVIDGPKQPELKSLVGKGFNPLAFRLLVLEHEYTNAINFTWEKLEASQNRLFKLRKLIAILLSLVSQDDFENPGDPETKVLELYQGVVGDNLNTPLLLEKFQQMLVETVDYAMKERKVNLKNIALIKKIDEGLLKLNLYVQAPGEIKELCDKRSEAKEIKDYALADNIRGKILNCGWQIEDLPWGFGLWKK